MSKINFSFSSDSQQTREAMFLSSSEIKFAAARARNKPNQRYQNKEVFRKHKLIAISTQLARLIKAQLKFREDRNCRMIQGALAESISKEGKRHQEAKEHEFQINTWYKKILNWALQTFCHQI